jgi:ABC-type lipoprotein release transport system permease subunit
MSVERQIRLPTSKAIEIAWKSIRLRLGRSLLVTSGIVLALAFLMAILTSDAMTDALRGWANERPAEATVAQLQPRQDLAAAMKQNGVPTTPGEIASSRIQTRWLLSLALLVAFVGILNAMLMSVTERFREIGTMKCLGALDSFIIKLFLLESLFQGLVGTVLGIAAGLGLSLLSLAASYGSMAFADVPMQRILFNVAFCFAIGVTLTVAGALYPAWQAARMQPIEAMRVET